MKTNLLNNIIVDGNTLEVSRLEAGESRIVSGPARIGGLQSPLILDPGQDMYVYWDGARLNLAVVRIGYAVN